MRPTIRDRVMMVNMVLFIVVGLLIFLRSTDAGGRLVGGAFIFLGVYRFYLFWTRRELWRQRSTR
ncbi:MAG TPA: hypothetical protein VFG95_01960 [Nitrospiria bacterium]|nr:hypothetical protein [Nitrospiria bacterium]